jgi:hypothetical protein
MVTSVWVGSILVIECSVNKFFFCSTMKTLVFLLLAISFQQVSFSQSPRKCGCETWRQWNASIQSSTKDTTANKKREYHKYLEGCLKLCRERFVPKQKQHWFSWRIDKLKMFTISFIISIIYSTLRKSCFMKTKACYKMFLFKIIQITDN